MKVLLSVLGGDMRRNGLGILVLLWGLSAGAAEEATSFQDWGLRCPTQGACVLSQRVFLEQAETPLLALAITPLGEKSALHALLRLPLGVALAPGVALQVDQGATQRWAYSHCDRDGCLAIQPFPEDLRAAFRAGREARVTFVSLDGKGVTVPVSLRGFSAGLKALEQGRR
jgi:invasion protein IalB